MYYKIISDYKCGREGLDEKHQEEKPDFFE